jgi:hypothetical protein
VRGLDVDDHIEGAIFERKMLGITNLKTRCTRVGFAAERDRFGGQIDTARHSLELLGQECHRAATSTANIQHATAHQVRRADELEGQPDRVCIENAVRHGEACLVA